MTPAFNESDGIVRFEWNNDQDEYHTRTVGVELKTAGGKKPPPPMDPATATIVSPADYLDISKKRMEGPLVVFECKVSDALLKKPDFKDLVKDPLTFRIGIKSKDGTKSFPGIFRAVIEAPPARIHWSAVNSEQESVLFSDKKPVPMDPTGKSSFHLACWVEEWNTPNRQYEIRMDDFYGFTHWIGENDPITAEIVCPRPEPWSKQGQGSTQKETDWFSLEPLPSQKYPNIPPLPVLTSIRVRAWRKDAIRARHQSSIDCDEKYRAETYVPLLLDARFEIHVRFEPDQGGRVYRTTTFKEKQEFETDSIDKVTFEVYARYKDRTPEQINEFADLKLSINNDSFALEEVSREKGKVKATVRSKIQMGGGNSNERDPTVMLKVEGKIRNPSGIEVDLEPIEESLWARYVRLRVEHTVEPPEARNGNGVALKADGESQFQVDLLLQKQNFYTGEWKDEDWADYTVAVRMRPGGSGGGDFDAMNKAREVAQQLVVQYQSPQVEGAHIKTFWRSAVSLPDPKFPFEQPEIALSVNVNAWRTK